MKRKYYNARIRLMGETWRVTAIAPPGEAYTAVPLPWAELPTEKELTAWLREQGYAPGPRALEQRNRDWEPSAYGLSFVKEERSQPVEELTAWLDTKRSTRRRDELAPAPQGARETPPEPEPEREPAPRPWRWPDIHF